MDVVLFHILYSISYSSCGLAFLVTLHSLLFLIRNHGSGALRLCLLPLWNAMPCLRSVKVCIYYAQLNPNLCNPMNCILSGFSVHGIFHSVILEWVVISSSLGSFQPRKQIIIWFVNLYFRRCSFSFCIT